MPALILSYPVLSHLSVALHQTLLEWLALVVLCAVPQYAALRAGRARNWLLLAALAGLLYLLTQAGGGIYVLLLPPVVLPAMAASFFIGTLRAGQVPLVTRMAAAERGVLPPELLSYTRNVTLFWAWLLSSQALAAILLGLFAPRYWWSLYTNFISYAVLGAGFVLEYGYRRLRFRHLPHSSFIGFMRSLLRTNYRAV